MTDLSPQYNPKDVEERLYQQWESAGLFHAEPDPSRQPDRWIGDSHLGDSQLRGGSRYFYKLTADRMSCWREMALDFLKKLDDCDR